MASIRGLGGQLPGVRIGGVPTTLPRAAAGILPAAAAAAGAAPGSNAGSGSGGSAVGGNGGVPTDAELQAAIAGDPQYLQTVANLNAQRDADAAQLAQTINQLMVQYGVTPDLAGAAGTLGLSNASLTGALGGLDPSTAGLAAMNTQNGTSILGRLEHNNTIADQTIRGLLASRNMLQSGDAGFRLGEQQRKYNQGLYDAFNTLMSALDRGQNTFASDQNSIANQLSTASQQAFTRQMNMLMQAGGQVPSSVGLAAPAGPAGGTVDAQQAAAAAALGITPQPNQSLNQVNAQLAAAGRPAQSYPSTISSQAPPVPFGGVTINHPAFATAPIPTGTQPRSGGGPNVRLA